jgi:hypothetical protein
MAIVFEGCPTKKQLSVVHIFVAKRLNAKDIHKEIVPVCCGKCLSRKAVHNLVEKFSQERSEVADDARTGRSVEIATEATVQPVKELIRADRRITRYSLATTLRCSHALAYSRIYDRFNFRNGCTRWVPRTWRIEKKMILMDLSLQRLLRYADGGEYTFNRIVTGDESWVHHYGQNQSVLQYNSNNPVHLQPKCSKFKVTPSAGKVMLTVHLNCQRGLLAHSHKRVKMWILHRTVKFCWSFGLQFAENVQTNRQEMYCFIMTMSDPLQLEQPRREFKNCSGNFLNIRLTAWTWFLVTFICLVR